MSMESEVWMGHECHAEDKLVDLLAGKISLSTWRVYDLPTGWGAPLYWTKGFCKFGTRQNFRIIL